MLHRRKMYFLFYQHWLIRMHTHPSSPATTGMRQWPLVYSDTTDKEAPTPFAGTNLPFHHPTTLIFWIWTSLCIKSLLHLSLLLWFNIFSDSDCRDTFLLNTLPRLYILQKQCESDTLCPLVLNHRTYLFNLTIIIDYYFYCEGFS